eukprot:1158620-Pelagomonas_calceolata.AAC.2
MSKGKDPQSSFLQELHEIIEDLKLLCNANGLPARRSWISSARPQTQLLHEHKRVLLQPVPSGPGGVDWPGWIPRNVSFFLATKHGFCSRQDRPLHRPATQTQVPRYKVLLGKHAKCQGEGCTERAKLAIFCSATKQISCRTLCPWPPHLTNTAVLPKTLCLACMPSLRAGGALGGPGQPGVNFTGSRQT